jgi:hypothetical protein
LRGLLPIIFSYQNHWINEEGAENPTIRQKWRT